MTKKLLLTLAFSSTCFTACQTSFVMSPHRSRETELAPAAAEGRYASVMERASTFEKQNAKSRDVHWYRVWRASAMIALGQVDEGDALIDNVLTDLSVPENTAAEISRLRMFAYDLKAKAAVAKQQPAQALGYLDRSMSLALDHKPETGSKCDYDLMIAARMQQIVTLAQSSGDQDRASRTRLQLDRKLEDWALCLGRADFPSMQVVAAVKGNLGVAPVIAAAGVPAAPVAAAPVAVAPVAAAPVAPAPVAVAPAPVAAAPAPVAPPPAGLGLQTTSVRYGPIDASPYKLPMENAVRLVERQHKGVQADALIRVDGSKRALRLRVPMKKLDAAADLVPIFKNTVVFFEQTRDVQPKIDEVLLAVETPAGTTQVVAQRGDIFDLFVDRLDVPAFTKRLVEVR